MSRLVKFWYQDNHPLKYLFYPLHWLLVFVVRSRRYFYQQGLLNSQKIPVPVIVVGNITVGGTGKSPLVMHLAERLTMAEFRVGILSRGYGGKSLSYPLEVTNKSLSSEVGDEPLMIKLRTDIDTVVVVDPRRCRGAQYLVDKYNCNLIICDDGLQHYALQRDIEILLIDGNRGFGNALLMPFGPLREPVSRAQQVDAVIVNGANKNLAIENTPPFAMSLKATYFVALNDSAKILEIAEFLNYCLENDEQLHAIAGIGNPQRFFDHLQELGLTTINHPFEDHYSFSVADLEALKGIAIMTEKDAVKCRLLATDKMWYLKVDADISPSISEYCLKLLT